MTSHIRLGKATEYFRSRNISQPVGRRGAVPLNFSRITELEYRDILQANGYSERYIEREISQLRKYRTALETAGVLGARRKLARKQEAEADPILSEYMQAATRRKERIKGRETTDEETKARGSPNLGGYSGRSRY